MVKTFQRVFFFSLFVFLVSNVFADGDLVNEKGKYQRYNRFGKLEFVRFDGAVSIAPEEFPNILKAYFGLSDDQFKLVKTEKDKYGFEHHEFRQKHLGYPVEGGYFRLHLKDNAVTTINGNLIPVCQPPAIVLNENEALNIALADVGAEKYIWEIPGEDNVLKYITKDPSATYFPSGELVYVMDRNHTNSWKLAWKFDIYASQPLRRADIYVDAATGQVISSNEKIQHADTTGTAVTRYSGTVSMVADSVAQDSFRLRETGRGGGVETYNLLTTTNYSAAVDFWDDDNYWDNANPQEDEVATDAHWGAEMTYDYFKLMHNRDSYDNLGTKLLSFVHYGQGYDNAFWNGQVMTYGDGGMFSPLTSIDVCAHEIGHGVTGNSAALVYSYEPGALNESFSDIFGAAVEHYARPSNANWLIGDDLTGGPIRSMSNPKSEQNPDTYHGQYWWYGAGDNGGVHYNSGVQNFWFYLLTEGGNGTNDNGDVYSVAGIGIDTAGQIAYRNLAVYLGPNSQYADARFYAIQSAIDLYGECSNPVIQTVNAWYAVGVGNEYTGTLVADFYTNDSLNCSAPLDVQFTNTSQSGFSYFWDFGDGATSTAISPSHTYTSAGSYSVTLIAYGCDSTIDTIVIPNAVIIDPEQPCVVNMPQGEDVTVTGCDGELYDSGGANNYLDNNVSRVTISPGGNVVVTLTFIDFEFAAGDLIYIYDGPDDQAPLLGYFSGNTNPGTFVSTGNTLTLKETSNAANNKTGFHATWSCGPPVSTPDPADMDLELFPNPATNSVTLQGYFPKKLPVEIQLVNALGQVIRSENAELSHSFSHQIDLNRLPAGMYFVRINGNDFSRNIRLVKD